MHQSDQQCWNVLDFRCVFFSIQKLFKQTSFFDESTSQLSLVRQRQTENKLLQHILYHHYSTTDSSSYHTRNTQMDIVQMTHDNHTT